MKVVPCCMSNVHGVACSCSKDAKLKRENSKLKVAQKRDADRYRWLRDRDLEAIGDGGLFVGKTPDNIVINGDDLDAEIDKFLTK